MVELSINQAIGLLRLASLGKMIGGLIHNVNGPMQNLGLEIDMSSHFMKASLNRDEIPITDIQKRLARMGDEFNRINQLIKDIAIRADVNNEYFALLNFNEFLEKELEFYHANLYFKHNVEVNLQLQDHSPMVRNLPENSMLALGWLITSIIEELENQEGKRLEIKTLQAENTLEVVIRAESIRFPENFTRQIAESTSIDIPSMIEESDIALSLAMTIFQSKEVTVKGDISGQDSSEINLRFPVYT